MSVVLLQQVEQQLLPPAAVQSPVFPVAMHEAALIANGEMIDVTSGKASVAPWPSLLIRSRRDSLTLPVERSSHSSSRFDLPSCSTASQTVASSTVEFTSCSISLAISVTVFSPSHCRQMSAAVWFRQCALWRLRS
jgi:hypothetical protein